jgi:hypothetical protein
MPTPEVGNSVGLAVPILTDSEKEGLGQHFPAIVSGQIVKRELVVHTSEDSQRQSYRHRIGPCSRRSGQYTQIRGQGRHQTLPPQVQEERTAFTNNVRELRSEATQIGQVQTCGKR